MVVVGQVVSVLAFYSDDLSSNPTEAYSFISVKFVFEKNEHKQKESGVGLFFNKFLQQSFFTRGEFQTVRLCFSVFYEWCGTALN